MKNMPKSVQTEYQRWIKHFPESFSATDVDLFYMFVHKLLSLANCDRDRYWLEENLQVDCPKLTPDNIKKYCDMYSCIKDFKNAPKRHTWKIVAASEFEQLKKKLVGQ